MGQAGAGCQPLEVATVEGGRRSGRGEGDQHRARPPRWSSSHLGRRDAGPTKCGGIDFVAAPREAMGRSSSAEGGCALSSWTYTLCLPQGLDRLGRLTLTTAHTTAQRLASSVDTPPEKLAKLAESRDAEVRRRVAHRPTCPPQTVGLLVGDVDPWVRCAAGGNPSISADLLARLADDVDDRVRGAVAGNPVVPDTLLRRMATDSSAWVRANVVMNPACPTELREALADSPDSELVRLAASGTMQSMERSQRRSRSDLVG